MKRKYSTATISALALLAGIFMGVTPAQAAPLASTLVLSGGNGVFGLAPITINATASSAGSVKFYARGVGIVGCESVPTTTTTPFVAKCSWLPATSGPITLGATFTPADPAAFEPAEAPAFNVKVGVPVQGVISPIHIYVDTILATGSTGVLAPRFGVGCTIASEFIVGQTIVFRIYANNADQGGAVMDSSNTAKAFVEVAGVKDPLPMTYGNHSGVAFWTAVLKTGAAPLYNTLGIISYKVTMVAKDTDSMKVLSSKLVTLVVDGKRVMENGKAVFERVSYYRTVKVSPVLKGATGTWSSNFTDTSKLTLYAVPKV